ncbi:MAG: hypothetical protein ABI471_11710 [Sphingomonas bacterium]
MWWLVLSVATACVVGIACFIAVRQCRRSWRNFAVLLSFALPPICWFVILRLAFWAGGLVATCSAPDCGELEFVAVMLFAMIASTGGALGAVIGVIWAWAWRKS